MNAPHATHIVEGYLARLELALTGSDPARRAELLEDVRAHIAEARAALTDETDAALLAILDRLGDPSAVADGLADEDRPREPRDRLASASPKDARSQWGLLELGALLLMIFAWPVGVLFAWLSRSWDRDEKIVATLIGALAFLLGWQALAPFVGLLLGPIVASLGSAAPVVLGSIGMLPLASAVYLAVRLGRRGAAFALA